MGMPQSAQGIAPHQVNRPVNRPVNRSWRYLALDGGGGAHLLTALAATDPHLREVFSPRHADLLLVVGPVTDRLAPSLASMARAVPHPAHGLIITGASAPHATPPGYPLESLLPGARQASSPTVEGLLEAVARPGEWPPLAVHDVANPELDLTSLPPRESLEMATEVAVLSLGPLQPFTAGPLRLWLLCDGDQVIQCHIAAGYAARDIAGQMRASDWRAAGEWAAQLDPLAPATGAIAYARALERLRHEEPTEGVTRARVGALAWERARNWLWWAVRFFSLLEDAPLHRAAFALAEPLGISAPSFNARHATDGAPGHSDGAAARVSAQTARTLERDVERLASRVAGNRPLRLRTRGIGMLDAHALRASGVTGPALDASVEGRGDVRQRLLSRLRAARTALAEAAEALAGAPDTPPRHESRYGATDVTPAPPEGQVETAVSGPRGTLGLRIVSDGGDHPAAVEWSRPSAALLALVPHILAGQKLADAEIILASLDLAMAEADG